MAVDHELEAIHGQVLARMGITPAFGGPRTVAAATAEENLSGLTMNSAVPVDMLGFPIPKVPDPVRIRRGTDPADWTWKQHSDHFQRLPRWAVRRWHEAAAARRRLVSAQPK